MMDNFLVVFFGLLLFSSSSSLASSSDQQQKWWKWSSSSGASSSKSSHSYGHGHSRTRGHAKSTIWFPLYGDVYPNGFYFAQVRIGQPPRPYFLDPDTGSDLTWLQCNAPCVHCTEAPHPYYRPNNDLVVCRDLLCASLHLGDYRCDNPEQCDYEVEYADGGSSLGVLLNDVFALNLTNGARISTSLALGCGYDQMPGASYHPLDGVLGLGRGRTSIVSQLHNQGLIQNVLGHCLSGRGGGFLFFGDDIYDASRTTWTQMSLDDTKHYSAGNAEVFFGGRSTGLKNLDVVFDSGSSYTYLSSRNYQIFLSLVMKELSGKPLREAINDRTLSVCWQGQKPFRSVKDVRKYFKPLTLSFANGRKARSQFEISPESYLIITSKGNVCLGIMNGTEIGLQNLNLIGDISMQDKMVIYDNEKKLIGWSPANCDWRPKSSGVFIM